MSAGKVIYGVLNGASAVTTIATGGIFPDIVPQLKVPPFVAYRTQSADYNETKDGVSDLDEFDVTVVSIAKTRTAAEGLAAAVRTALDGYEGTINSVVVDSIYITDESNRYNNDAEMVEIEQDYTIRIENS